MERERERIKEKRGGFAALFKQLEGTHVESQMTDLSPTYIAKFRISRSQLFTICHFQL